MIEYLLNRMMVTVREQRPELGVSVVVRRGDLIWFSARTYWSQALGEMAWQTDVPESMLVRMQEDDRWCLATSLVMPEVLAGQDAAERLDALTRQVRDLALGREGHSQAIDEHWRRMNAIEASVGNVNAALDRAARERGALQDEVRTLEEDRIGQGDALDSLRQRVAEHANRLKHLESR